MGLPYAEWQYKAPSIEIRKGKQGKFSHITPALQILDGKIRWEIVSRGLAPQAACSVPYQAGESFLWAGMREWGNQTAPAQH